MNFFFQNEFNPPVTQNGSKSFKSIQCCNVIKITSKGDHFSHGRPLEETVFVPIFSSTCRCDQRHACPPFLPELIRSRVPIYTVERMRRFWPDSNHRPLTRETSPLTNLASQEPLHRGLSDSFPHYNLQLHSSASAAFRKCPLPEINAGFVMI